MRSRTVSVVREKNNSDGQSKRLTKKNYSCIVLVVRERNNSDSQSKRLTKTLQQQEKAEHAYVCACVHARVSMYMCVCVSVYVCVCACELACKVRVLQKECLRFKHGWGIDIEKVIFRFSKKVQHKTMKGTHSFQNEL